MRLGFVTAMADEARTLECLADLHEIALAGIGPDRAASAADALLTRGIDALVSWGTAGALAPTLTAGDVLVYESTRDESGATHPCDRELYERVGDALAGQGVQSGAGYTVPRAVAAAAEKSRLHDATGCFALDMESAAVGAAAGRAGIGYCVVRAVVDPAGFTLPRAALSGIAEDGTTRPWAVIATLARRPGELPRLLQLARWHRLALARLAAAAATLRPAFAGANDPARQRAGNG